MKVYIYIYCLDMKLGRILHIPRRLRQQNCILLRSLVERTPVTGWAAFCR